MTRKLGLLKRILASLRTFRDRARLHLLNRRFGCIFTILLLSMILAIFTQISHYFITARQKNTNKRRTMTITGSSPEHDLKATNDGDISNPPAQDPHSTGGINSPRSSHKTASSRPSCPATDEHSVLHDGARIMTMPAIPRSNPLIPSTSVSSHHGTHTRTVQTSQFHDSECKNADFDLSSTDSDHDDDDQLKNKGCRDRRVFFTDSNDDNSDDLKGARLFSPKKENAHQKRAREVREAAEVNEETPRKRSRLNSGPNDDATVQLA